MHNYKVNIIIIAQKRLEFRTKDGDTFQQDIKAEGEWMKGTLCNSPTGWGMNI